METTIEREKRRQDDLSSRGDIGLHLKECWTVTRGCGNVLKSALGLGVSVNERPGENRDEYMCSEEAASRQRHKKRSRLLWYTVPAEKKKSILRKPGGRKRVCTRHEMPNVCLGKEGGCGRVQRAGMSTSFCYRRRRSSERLRRRSSRRCDRERDLLRSLRSSRRSSRR